MASNNIQNVAIVGATGSVGAYITEHLLKTGKHTITAITRAESKSKMPEGVKVAKVNYDDLNTLIDALTGQDAIIITMASGAGAAQASLIEAAAKAKVGWVMTNEYCPDVTARPDMGNVSSSSRQILLRLRH